MGTVPPRDDFMTLSEWVDAASENTDIERETLWDIVEEFKPGAGLMTGGEKEVQLLTLLEHHHEKLTAAGDNPGPAPFINVYFPYEGEVESLYQFQWGAYNIVNLNDEREKAFRELIDDEDLEIMIEDKSHITAADYDWTPEEALRVSTRVLNHVFGVSLEDVERAVEIDGKTGEEVAWTQV
ncbi:hypothetical protein [Natronosalvus amylolyticus]|uniref:hypothetical protein n=1 Tax=Natronosalvus amylolyticus TaxID=2961994 RepID=UPI0020C956ED|nr:hypothetical protein [Natronosalvus amylolyticus]